MELAALLKQAVSMGGSDIFIIPGSGLVERKSQNSFTPP